MDEEEEEEEDIEDEILITNSPEPEPFEPEDAMQTDENGQPGRLHPEQDLPHIFRVGVMADLFFFYFGYFLFNKC